MVESYEMPARRHNPHELELPQSARDALRGIDSASIAQKIKAHLQEQGLNDPEFAKSESLRKEELYGISAYLLTRMWNEVQAEENELNESGGLKLAKKGMQRDIVVEDLDQESVDELIEISPWLASRQLRLAFAGLYLSSLNASFDRWEEMRAHKKEGEEVPYEIKAIERFEQVVREAPSYSRFDLQPKDFIRQGIGTASAISFDLQQVIIPTYMQKTGHGISAEEFVMIRNNSRHLLTELASQSIFIFTKIREALKNNRGSDIFDVEFFPESFFITGSFEDGTLSMQIQPEIFEQLRELQQAISNAIYFENQDAEKRIGCPALHIRVERDGQKISMVDHAFEYTSKIFDRAIVPYLGEEGRYTQDIFDQLTDPRRALS